jgi:DNA-binding MarR family transcriptional regulator
VSGRARDTDPQTSHDAANNVNTLALKSRYLMALYRLGPSSTTEIAFHWDMPRDSFSPRTPDLIAKGLIVHLGRRPCANPGGRVVQMNLYDLTTKGRAAVAEAHQRVRDRT